MTFKLIARTEARLPLAFIRPFRDYASAVLHGQQHFGRGNFYVDTPGVPSRAEQLLQPTKTKRKNKLDLL